jgi:hypothetical protein
MAHSIQTIGEKSEIFKDADLIALVCLLNLEATSNPGEYPALNPVIAQWMREIAASGPGTIDLKLDELPTGGREKSEMRALLAAIERNIALFGNAVPAAILNEQCPLPGITFNDFKTSFVKDAVDKLRGLLVE